MENLPGQVTGARRAALPDVVGKGPLRTNSWLRREKPDMSWRIHVLGIRSNPQRGEKSLTTPAWATTEIHDPYAFIRALFRIEGGFWLGCLAGSSTTPGLPVSFSLLTVNPHGEK